MVPSVKLLGKGRTQIRGWAKDSPHFPKAMGGVVKGRSPRKGWEVSPHLTVTFISTVNTVKQ